MSKAQENLIRAYIRKHVSLYNKDELRLRVRLRYVAYGIDEVFKIFDHEYGRLTILGEAECLD